MFKYFLFRKHGENHAIYLKIVSYQATLDDLYIGLTPLSLVRVVRGHVRSNVCFAYNFWQNSDRAVGSSPMCFSRRDASLICYMTYLSHDMTSLGLDLSWNFDIVIFGQYSYISTRPDESNNMAPKLLHVFDLTTFLSSKAICKNFFFQKQLFWPFLTFVA